MPSAVTQEMRPPLGVNRWTLEPLLLGILWMFTFASAIFASALVAAGLGAALAVAAVISLWAAAAVVRALVQARKGSR